MDTIEDMTAEFAQQLLTYATQEEKEVFDIVSRSTDEKVLADLGKTKEVILASFMINWAMRAGEE